MKGSSGCDFRLRGAQPPAAPAPTSLDRTAHRCIPLVETGEGVDRMGRKGKGKIRKFIVIVSCRQRHAHAARRSSVIAKGPPKCGPGEYPLNAEISLDTFRVTITESSCLSFPRLEHFWNLFLASHVIIGFVVVFVVVVEFRNLRHVCDVVTHSARDVARDVRIA